MELNQLEEINGGYSKKAVLAIGGAAALVIGAPVAGAIGGVAAFGAAYAAGATLLGSSLS
ncbi:hypothetical protein NX821_002320 [Clostridium septicum]|uniref:hypothetical protein n=1 Tax=Clostridium septicum TaxID=1504 RepID=UPI0032162549